MLADFITSRFGGRPVELYKFTYGPNSQDTFRYTDGESPIIYLGETFVPLPIQRGPTSNTGTLDKTTLEVTMPHTAKLPQLFRIYPPGHTIGLTVLQGQVGDPDNQFIAVWVGRVISVSFEGIEAKVSAEPIVTSFRRSGLRRNYQYQCPHALFGPQCRASKAAATTTATAFAVTGRSVTLSTLLVDASRYVGGMVEWDTPSGRVEARTILSTSTDSGRTVVFLTGLPSEMTAGSALRMIRGCRHTLTACEEDHNNAVNYGGDPWIPTKNPIGNVSPFQ